MIEFQRLLGTEGLVDLVRLSRAFFLEYEEHHDELFRIDKLEDGKIIEYFSRFLSGDDQAVFVARREGEIVGYITVCIQAQPTYWRVRRIGHISGLMVQRTSRREGIGAGLLAQARAHFRDQGVKYYTVYTAVENREALSFYRGQGLEPLHTHLIGRA